MIAICNTTLNRDSVFDVLCRAGPSVKCKVVALPSWKSWASLQQKSSFLYVQTNWVCQSYVWRYDLTNPVRFLFSLKKSSFFIKKMTLTLPSSHWLWLESNWVIRSKTLLESSHQNCDSSRVFHSSHANTVAFK